jgi:peptide/nickel transport system substrate-binding protein
MILIPDWLVACGPSQPSAGSEKVVKGGHITDSIPSDIVGFNPVLVAEGPVQSTPQSLLFTGLLVETPTGDLLPRLAQSMPQVSPDGKTYTFTLRKGVKWTDGNPLTADDVVYTYRLMYHPDYAEVRSPYRGDMSALISDVSAPDPNTVVIKLKAANSSFLLVHGRHYVVPKHILGALTPAGFNTSDFNRNPQATSGPFKLQEFKRGDHITFVRNDDYFLGAPNIDRLVFRQLLANPAADALKSGDLDVMTLRASRIDEMKALDSVTVQVYDTAIGTAIYFNLDPNKPSYKVLGSKAVRQALAYGADRAGAIKAVLFNYGVVPASIYTPTSWAYNPAAKSQYPYDKAKAIALLESDGWKVGASGVREKGGVPLKFELITPAEGPEYNRIAEIFQQNWKDIGITLTIRPVPFAQLTSRVLVDRSFDAVANNPISTLIGADPDVSAIFHSRNAAQGSRNFTFYKNQKLDQLLDAGVATTDQAKRKEIYFQIQDILNEDVPMFTAMYWRYGWAFNKRVKGLTAPRNVGSYDSTVGRPFYNEAWVTNGK